MSNTYMSLEQVALHKGENGLTKQLPKLYTDFEFFSVPPELL